MMLYLIRYLFTWPTWWRGLSGFTWIRRHEGREGRPRKRGPVGLPRPTRNARTQRLPRGRAAYPRAGRPWRPRWRRRVLTPPTWWGNMMKANILLYKIINICISYLINSLWFYWVFCSFILPVPSAFCPITLQITDVGILQIYTT